MVHDAVHDHTHTAAMDLFHKLDKKLIGCLQIFFVGNAGGIVAILDDDTVVRIDIIVILGVILMIGGGHKDGIQIQYFYAQVLEIIQFVPHALQVTTVKTMNIHALRHAVPIFYRQRIAF